MYFINYISNFVYKVGSEGGFKLKHLFGTLFACSLFVTSERLKLNHNTTYTLESQSFSSVILSLL